jgi:hypothetical protein
VAVKAVAGNGLECPFYIFVSGRHGS